MVRCIRKYSTKGKKTPYIDILMYAESKVTKRRKIKIIYEQSECRQISIGYESKLCVNIKHNGFVRVFQTDEIGCGLKKVNKIALRNPV